MSLRDFPFWAKVKKTRGCWLWRGAISHKSYGEIKVAGVVEYAHRVAYELRFGPLLPGFMVLHRCDNPPCVRWAHLFPGTNSINMQDAYRKKRR